MGKENPSYATPPEDHLKVKLVHTFDPKNWNVFKTIDIPTGIDGFSTGAIKEILSQMVWGYNPGRAVSFIPSESENGDPVVLTSEDLRLLRNLPREDRLCELDTHAMKIKASSVAVIIERM